MKVLTFAIAFGFAAVAFAQDSPPSRGYVKVNNAYSAAPSKAAPKTSAPSKVVFTSKTGVKTPAYIYKVHRATRPLKTW